MSKERQENDTTTSAVMASFKMIERFHNVHMVREGMVDLVQLIEHYQMYLSGHDVFLLLIQAMEVHFHDETIQNAGLLLLFRSRQMQTSVMALKRCLLLAIHAAKFSRTKSELYYNYYYNSSVSMTLPNDWRLAMICRIIHRCLRAAPTLYPLFFNEGGMEIVLHALTEYPSWDGVVQTQVCPMLPNMANEMWSRSPYSQTTKTAFGGNNPKCMELLLQPWYRTQQGYHSILQTNS